MPVPVLSDLPPTDSSTDKKAPEDSDDNDEDVDVEVASQHSQKSTKSSHSYKSVRSVKSSASSSETAPSSAGSDVPQGELVLEVVYVDFGNTEVVPLSR